VRGARVELRGLPGFEDEVVLAEDERGARDLRGAGAGDVGLRVEAEEELADGTTVELLGNSSLQERSVCESVVPGAAACPP
jgi:hypothetical protein